MLNKIQFGFVIVCFTLSLTIISLSTSHISGEIQPNSGLCSWQRLGPAPSLHPSLLKIWKYHWQWTENCKSGEFISVTLMHWAMAAVARCTSYRALTIDCSSSNINTVKENTPTLDQAETDWSKQRNMNNGSQHSISSQGNSNMTIVWQTFVLRI